MEYNFKPLRDIEEVSSLSDDDYLLIESGAQFGQEGTIQKCKPKYLYKKNPEILESYCLEIDKEYYVSRTILSLRDQVSGKPLPDGNYKCDISGQEDYLYFSVNFGGEGITTTNEILVYLTNDNFQVKRSGTVITSGDVYTEELANATDLTNAIDSQEYNYKKNKFYLSNDSEKYDEIMYNLAHGCNIIVHNNPKNTLRQNFDIYQSTCNMMIIPNQTYNNYIPGSGKPEQDEVTSNSDTSSNRAHWSLNFNFEFSPAVGLIQLVHTSDKPDELDDTWAEAEIIEYK